MGTHNLYCGISGLSEEIEAPSLSDETLIVIGAGASGAATLIEIASCSRESGHRRFKKIILIERTTQLGRGLAFGKAEAPYLQLNMRTSEISITGKEGDFTDWLVKRGIGSAHDFADHYAARALCGNYISDRVAEAVDGLEAFGTEVQIIRGEAVALWLLPNCRYLVHLLDESMLVGDRVILATGHSRSKTCDHLRQYPGFLESPYDPKFAATIRPELPSLIVGSSLTAIDSAKAILSLGGGNQICLVSRGGILPAVRRFSTHLHRSFPRHLHALKDRDSLSILEVLAALDRDVREIHEDPLPLQHLFPVPTYRTRTDGVRRFQEDLRRVHAGKAGYQNVLEELDGDLLEEIWTRLLPDDKRYLLRYSSHYRALRHPMPPATAKQIENAISQNQIHVKRLRAREGITYDPRRGEFIAAVDGGTVTAPQLVGATSTSDDLETSDNPLLQQALRTHQIERHPLGGIDVDRATCRVVVDRKINDRLFALGPMTSGVFFYVSAMSECVRHARKVVTFLMQKCELSCE